VEYRYQGSLCTRLLGILRAANAYKIDGREHYWLFLMCELDITNIKPKLDETSTALLNKRVSKLTLEGETRRRKLYLL
jgi:hypothetical protein